MISRNLMARLMAPLLMSLLLLAILAGVTLHLQNRVAASNAAVTDAQQRALALGEIRSLSRSLQRDSLNLILETDAAERTTIETKVMSRSGKMAATLREERAGPGGAAMPQDYFTTQQAVLREIAGVVRQAKAGQPDAALRHFQQSVRPAERAASRIADARIDALTDQVAALRTVADEAAREAQTLLLVATIALSAIGLAAGFLITRHSVVIPLHQLRASMERLAAGRTDDAVPHGDRADEVGQMARSMTTLRDQLVSAETAKAAQTALIVDNIGGALSKLAAGDLVTRLDAELTGPFAKLQTDFNQAAAALQSALAKVAEAARDIDSGAGDIAQASDDLSQRTERQAASLEETAAAMQQITTTVRHTAARAGSANAAVQSARDEARRSGEVVRRAVEAMGGIERTSTEISDIISVIDGIAFQTNLLALNAGVEAARAGDAGKGFAVVASEVRALAQRSADAAKDVKARIGASSQQVAAGVELVGETGQALEHINARIAEIDTLVGEIAASTEQQALGLQQVNIAVTEMDGVTQQNAAMVEQATAAARCLVAEVDGMRRSIGRFRIGEGSSPAPSPVHALHDRLMAAGRRPAPPRADGNAAVAMDDDWVEF